jgi:hypothetical protein
MIAVVIETAAICPTIRPPDPDPDPDAEHADAVAVDRVERDEREHSGHRAAVQDVDHVDGPEAGAGDQARCDEGVVDTADMTG